LVFCPDGAATRPTCPPSHRLSPGVASVAGRAGGAGGWVRNKIIAAGAACDLLSFVEKG